MGAQTGVQVGAAAMIAADILVGLVLAYLWLHNGRERHVGSWFLAYCLQLLLHVLWLPIYLGRPHLALYILGSAAAIASVAMLVRGAYTYLGRTEPRLWLPLAGVGLVATVILSLGDIAPPMIFAPLGLALAGGQAVAGITILVHRSSNSLGSWLAGVGLIGAGLHMADYPLLAHIQALVPWGQLTDSWLRLTCGFGLVLLQVERAQQQRKELEQRLEQAEKLEAIGRLAGGVAHDFNNLLTVISAHSSLAMVDAAPRTQEALAHIDDATARSAKLARQLLAFSRPTKQRVETLDLAALVLGMKTVVRTAVHEAIELQFELEDSSYVSGDATQLEQVVLNLAMNARDAMPGGGRLSISTKERPSSPQESNTHGLPARVVTLEVSDTGLGMSEEVRAHIFEPFYTTKDVGKGSGLGLFTVYATVRSHGGVIEVCSEPGEGTLVRIVLPRAHPDCRTTSIPTPRFNAVPRGTRLLVVEDDPPLRRAIGRIADESGLQVTLASTGIEALELARMHPFELVVTDVIMPKMGGLELARRLRTELPALPLLFMSGYAPEESCPRGLSPDEELLPKPFTAEEFLGAVERILRTRLESKRDAATQDPAPPL